MQLVGGSLKENYGKKDEVQHPYEISDCFAFAYYCQESKSL